MAPTYKDRVRQTTSTTGTGTYSLDGSAPTGFRSFVGAGLDTLEVEYCVTMGGDWEVGRGTVTAGSPDTLSRDTVLDSSNSGNAVDWGAGTKAIFLTLAAASAGGGGVDSAALDTAFGDTQGRILYRGSGGWTTLAGPSVFMPYHVLSHNGGTGAPLWLGAYGHCAADYHVTSTVSSLSVGGIGSFGHGFLIRYRIKNGGTNNGYYTMRPNGLTTNLYGRFAANGSGSNFSDWTFAQANFSSTGEFQWGHILLHFANADTYYASGVKGFRSYGASLPPGGNNPPIHEAAGVWNETSSDISYIEFHGPTNGIGAGSRFLVYRLLGL